MAGSIFIFLSILSTLGASVFLEPLPKRDIRGLSNDFADSFQNLEEYPKLEELSEKDWIDIISGTLNGERSSKYLQEQNFTLNANQTGFFIDSAGLEGNWTANSVLDYFIDEQQTRILSLSVDSRWQDGFQMASGMRSATTYTKSGLNITAIASIREIANFQVDQSGTYTLQGESQTFGNGISTVTSDMTYFSQVAITASNYSNVISVSMADVAAEIVSMDERSYLVGASAGEVFPLNGLETIPRNPSILASLMKNSKDSSIVQYENAFYGDFSVGREGEYESGSITSSASIGGDVTNTTSTEHGYYWEADPSIGNYLELIGMIEFIINLNI